ncbi:MscS Mechanosensitive ion channel [methanotrophic bacterial endosymbiont of Bathymodiolus sp.]|nr:MscS Mechanosensitive ion channel [methanotrophic bacterial endosymbiont of Bathymodiolus sp.]
MREQRNTLETNKQLYQRQVDISEETGLISLALYKIELRQKQLLNIQAELDLQLQQVENSLPPTNLSASDIQEIRQELDELLNNQKEVLSELSNTYLKDLRKLGDYQFASEQLLILIDQYAAYLDERLLWVPSSLPINLDYPLDIYNSMRWFGSPKRWFQLVENLLTTVKSKSFISFCAGVFWFFLLYLNFYISQKVCAIREKVGKPYTDKIYYTFQVLLFNFIMVLPVPLLLFFISWELSLLPLHHDFSRAIGVGLYHAAIVLMILQFFTRFLEDQGIAELHFRWQKKTICKVRKQLAWMQFVIIPCIFIIYMTSANNVAEHSDSIGRLGLITFISLLFVFAIRLFQPGQGILDDYFINNTKLWWANLRYLWLIVFISIPVISQP